MFESSACVCALSLIQSRKIRRLARDLDEVEFGHRSLPFTGSEFDKYYKRLSTTASNQLLLIGDADDVYSMSMPTSCLIPANEVEGVKRLLEKPNCYVYGVYMLEQLGVIFVLLLDRGSSKVSTLIA